MTAEIKLIDTLCCGSENIRGIIGRTLFIYQSQHNNQVRMEIERGEKKVRAIEERDGHRLS